MASACCAPLALCANLATAGVWNGTKVCVLSTAKTRVSLGEKFVSVLLITSHPTRRAMDVSCWSFIRMAQLAEPLMKNGGTLSTMTYYGSQMVVENYNMMGPVKAALEAVTRYLAAELGPKGIRVHAISPGPLKTRAASGISDFDILIAKAQAKAPARSLVSIEDVGVAVAFLSMNGAKLITGETLYIDGGYHIID